MKISYQYTAAGKARVKSTSGYMYYFFSQYT